VTKFPVHVAKDGEKFSIGKVTIEVLHTPGHTLESSCYLLKDENGKDHCVFTGDTLFVGDVGRPDLAQKGEALTMQDLAGMMYDSIHAKLFPLADDVIVYPAHGAGSACGKSIGKETFSTIGEQKRHNYALEAKTKEEFIQKVTEGIAAPPQYFPINAQINKEGYESLDQVLQQGLKPLSVAQFKTVMNDDNVILDTRTETDFVKGFVPGSINIGLNGRFAEWAGSLLPFDKPIYLVTEPGKEKETIVRLARVGFEKINGHLEGGFEAWKKAGGKVDMIVEVEPDELLMDMQFDNNLIVVDVRKENEFAEGHLPDAMNLPLSEMTDPATMANIEDGHNLYIHCAGGYRSVIACSLLKRQGIHNLRNIAGGWNAIRDLGKVEIVKEKSVLN
jgi:rhodanese-related sulfurtransferase